MTWRQQHTSPPFEAHQADPRLHQNLNNGIHRDVKLLMINQYTIRDIKFIPFTSNSAELKNVL